MSLRAVPRSSPRRASGDAALARVLEELYARYTRRERAHPDPVEFLHRYSDVRDREVAGLVAASLAFGRVAGILTSVARVLNPMGSSPARYLKDASRSKLRALAEAFRHRWTTDAELLEYLLALQGMLRAWGTIEDAFAAGWTSGDATVLPALTRWVAELSRWGLAEDNSLMPRPEKRAACKRLHLYLRWMVRRDDVDPGGWGCVPPSHLLIPLDVHMHRIGRALHFTRRAQANQAAVLDVTAGFRRIAPADPVRYDFALTRMPILDRMPPARIRAALLARGPDGVSGES